MWIFLWLVLSVFILGVFFWSTAILHQQKKAWAAAAKRLDLTYSDGGRMTASPTITGQLGGFKISFFNDRQKTADLRGERFITAIEVEMGPGAPASAIIAAPSYRGFLAEAKIEMTETFTPAAEGWRQDLIVMTRDVATLTAYLTPDKLKTLVNLFAMKNTQTLFFCDDNATILRVETSDPLRNADRLEKIARRLTQTAAVLAPPQMTAK